MGLSQLTDSGRRRVPFFFLNRSVSPYAEIVADPDSDSEKCAYELELLQVSICHYQLPKS